MSADLDTVAPSARGDHDSTDDGSGSDDVSESESGESDEELPCFMRLATKSLEYESHSARLVLGLPLTKVTFEDEVGLFDGATESWTSRHLVLCKNVVYIFEDDSKQKATHIFHLLGEYFAVCTCKYDSRPCVRLLQDGGGVGDPDGDGQGRVLSLRTAAGATDLAKALQHGADLSFSDMYDRKGELGKGAIAVVYEAIHKETDTAYAVKVTKKEDITNCIDSIVREIEIMCRIQHPNVIRLVDLFESEDQLYIVSELLSGGELFDHISGCTDGFTEKMASWYMKSILQAIAYLHRNNMVHRDVKPENLLLVSKSKDTELRLVDFGIARHLGLDELSMTMAGTPNYISPEVVAIAQDSSRGYSHGVDVWAAGVIMYLLVCGFHPFASDNAAETLELIADAKLVFPSPFADHVSEAAKDLIAKMLKKDPAERVNAEQCLVHPWISGITEIPDTNLASALSAIRRMNAKKKLRKVVRGIIVIRRLSQVFKSSGKKKAKEVPPGEHAGDVKEGPPTTEGTEGAAGHAADTTPEDLTQTKDTLQKQLKSKNSIIFGSLVFQDTSGVDGTLDGTREPSSPLPGSCDESSGKEDEAEKDAGATTTLTPTRPPGPKPISSCRVRKRSDLRKPQSLSPQLSGFGSRTLGRARNGRKTFAGVSGQGGNLMSKIQNVKPRRAASLTTDALRTVGDMASDGTEARINENARSRMVEATPSAKEESGPAEEDQKLVDPAAAEAGVAGGAAASVTGRSTGDSAVCVGADMSGSTTGDGGGAVASDVAKGAAGACTGGIGCDASDKDPGLPTKLDYTTADS